MYFFARKKTQIQIAWLCLLEPLYRYIKLFNEFPKRFSNRLFHTYSSYIHPLFLLCYKTTSSLIINLLSLQTPIDTCSYTYTHTHVHPQLLSKRSYYNSRRQRLTHGPTSGIDDLGQGGARCNAKATLVCVCVCARAHFLHFIVGGGGGRFYFRRRIDNFANAAAGYVGEIRRLLMLPPTRRVGLRNASGNGRV